MACIEEYNLYTYTLTNSHIDSSLSVGPQSNTIVSFYYRFFLLSFLSAIGCGKIILGQAAKYAHVSGNEYGSANAADYS